MGFKEAVVNVLSNYATFSGRARRSEYWYFTLFNILVSGAFGILALVFGDGFFGAIVTMLSRLASLALFVPGLAVIWRRLHDTGRSGAWWFIIFVPLVGAILLLVWFCKDSQPGENQYGPNPKENTWTSGY